MAPEPFDITLGIGGAAGQGIATPGNLLARLFARRGLHLYTYNAHQSLIRGGHSLLTMRVSQRPVTNHGDGLRLLITLNQDSMDRHLRHAGEGARVLFNSDLLNPGPSVAGVKLCPLPVKQMGGGVTDRRVQNTLAAAAALQLLGVELGLFEQVIGSHFVSKGEAVVEANLTGARLGHAYAADHFEPLGIELPRGPKPLGVWQGNEATALGAVAAGMNFYCAYPMSPATGILHWLAAHSRELGILARQAEDEIAAVTQLLGAGQAGCRAMTATSGGGFALMSEAVSAAGMMEIPLVIVDVMRAGPSTGLPTKTEQGDLWQALGAGQGDYPRFVVAPRDALDAFRTMPALFDLTDAYQCPGLVLTDLLLAEGTFTVDPDQVDLQPPLDRGPMLTSAEGSQVGEFFRYELTPSGVSPRALPGTPGLEHTVASDEHDRDWVLISDVFTNPHKRRAMLEKRQRKVPGALARIAPPELEGPAQAPVTLVGWGSTYGALQEARAQLAAQGLITNQLHFKWLVPFHVDRAHALLGGGRSFIVVENNQSGAFHRYLRSETGLTALGHIRKYDGEPFMPHHITAGVKEIVEQGTGVYVPTQEIMV